MYNPKKFIYATNNILKSLGKMKVEYILAFMCSNGKPIRYIVVEEGDRYSCPFPIAKLNRIAEICRNENLNEVVIVHNHPPFKFVNLINTLSQKIFKQKIIEMGMASGADYKLTRDTKYNLDLYNIKLLDHLIVTQDEVLSFQANNYFIQ